MRSLRERLQVFTRQLRIRHGEEVFIDLRLRCEVRVSENIGGWRALRGKNRQGKHRRRAPERNDAAEWQQGTISQCDSSPDFR